MRIPVVIRILFLSLLTLFLSGCLQIQQVIEIRKENKGSFKLEISLPLEIYQKFIAGDKVPEAKYFDPVKGTAYFAATDGFRIKKYRVFDNAEEGGAMRKYIQVEGDITDVKKALASGKLGDFEYTPKEKEPSTLVLKMGSMGATEGAAKLREAAAGLKLYIKLEVPGKITETSAAKKEHGRDWASWTFNADSDPSFLQTPPKISVTYK